MVHASSGPQIGQSVLPKLSSLSFLTTRTLAIHSHGYIFSHDEHKADVQEMFTR